MQHDVVVTGYALVAPGAMDAATLFNRITAGQSALQRHPTFEALQLPNPVAGFLSAEQWQQVHAGTPSLPNGTERPSRLLDFVARQLLAQTQLTTKDFWRLHAGLFIGANKFCATSADFAALRWCQDDDKVVDLDRSLDQPLARPIHSFRVDQQTHHLAHMLGIRDHVSTHADACAAGTTAIGHAFDAIRRGDLDVALCGAVELMADELPYYMFNGVGALCQKADWLPHEQSRPFRRDRCGFVLSEGAALVLLESRAHAVRRNAAVLGRVLGFSVMCEAEKMTASKPDGSKYATCMRAALADARCSAGDVQHINTHGTSTPTNDLCEARAIEDVFSSHLDHITLTANKSAIGHSLAASGAIEAILSLLSIAKSTVLPTLNHDPQHTEFPRLRFSAQAHETPIHTVLSNSFGFGGVNSSLVLARA